MEKISTIAHTTFLELIRSKLLYSILFFAVVLVGASTVLGSMTVGDQIKIMKNLGFFAVSFFSVLFCVIAGANLLHKELMRKTIYNILGKAVSRTEFITGKFLGIFATSSLVLLGMGASLSSYLALFEGHVDWGLAQSYLFILLELSIISAATIFFSSIVITPFLVGLFSLSTFIAGRSASLILKFADISGSSIAKYIYVGIPHLDTLNPANQAALNEIMSVSELGYGILYAGSYSVILIILAIMAFRRRQFN